MSPQHPNPMRPSRKGGGPHGPHGPHGGAPVEKAKNAKGTVRRLLTFIKPEIPKIVLVLVCAVIATLFDILCPRQLGMATTEIFRAGVAIANGEVGAGVNFELLKEILLILIILYVCYQVFTYLQAFVMARVAQNVVYSLRQQTEEKLNRIPLSYYDSHSKGDILSRVVNDIDLISTTLQDGMTQALTSVITIIGVFIMMMIMSPLVTVIALCTLPVSVALTAIVAKRSQRFFLAQQTSLGILDAHIEETYGGHTEVKAFAHEQGAIEDFERINNEYFGHAWRAQFVSGLIRPLMIFVGNLAYIAIVCIGGWQAIVGAITVGEVQAFTQYMRNFTRPISQLAGIINTFQATIAGAERVFEILDQPEMSDETGLLPDTTKGRGHIEFEHVRFGYDPAKPVIHDLSVEVQPGQMVAIVGPTGAGKTTLVNLLMRFYEIDAGAISAASSVTSCVLTWAWCSRIPGCSTAPYATTSPMALTRQATKTSSVPRVRPMSITSSTRFPTATTPSSTRRHPTSRLASASSSPSRAPCSPTPRFSFSTRRPAPSTRAPSASCSMR